MVVLEHHLALVEEELHRYALLARDNVIVRVAEVRRHERRCEELEHVRTTHLVLAVEVDAPDRGEAVERERRSLFLRRMHTRAATLAASGMRMVH